MRPRVLLCTAELEDTVTCRQKLQKVNKEPPKLYIVDASKRREKWKAKHVSVFHIFPSQKTPVQFLTEMQFSLVHACVPSKLKF